MAPNKKAAKKAVTHKPKPAKAAPKKAVKAAKPAPKKVAKPAKQAKPARAVAHKPAPKKTDTKKPVHPKAPVKSAVPPKKAAVPIKHEPAKKAVKEVPAVPEKQSSSKFEQIKKAAKAQVEKTKVSKPVVIPKLSTNQARKYEPEFTQSVLDRPAVQQSGPTMKYSDTELIEFRELILRKLEAAKKELNYLQGLITRKDDMGGDESENRYMTMEDGSISMEREQLSQMASRQIQYIDHLEKAMMRIENKTYGICRVTGKLIDKARLRAVPHATLSIEAKMGFAKNPNIQ
ncbi:TraR/DksA family transcriptional regulator [Agriterribacter sp.]|uniref:TraR/DksA family transcriptional regulator n=1 Tax=Agriterribacter sp. TaxID=2821509 RepID=UPI002B63ABD0|nr:TraR/DksA C4-type zinc finger protein [Agriterribacter sp.]HTN05260.1 TraR/DksA C4-type zinc finger protein [Agriterribacter sp.]